MAFVLVLRWEVVFEDDTTMQVLALTAAGAEAAARAQRNLPVNPNAPPVVLTVEQIQRVTAL